MKKYQTKLKNVPLSINYIYESNKLLIVTKKDIRLYNMSTGAIEKVFCDYHSKDEEIVVFRYYELMKKVLIGNEKGEIKLFNLGGIAGSSKNFSVSTDGKSIKEEKLQGFENGLVTHIEYDQDNQLFLTCGENGTINIEKRVLNFNQSELRVDEDDQA